MSFFEELKRRNVFRVGIAYIISAWVLLQFADLVLGNIQAPEWVIKVFMLALAIGFPLAIFFAWAFELTPEGIKKEKDVDRSQSIAKVTGHKLDRTIIVILFIALVYFAWDNFNPADKGPGSISSQENQVAENAAAGQLNPDAASQMSIAVLPFVNMSTDTENEFFSDGISEEILNVLASIPDLKVAARTSAFAYKGTNTNISKIAQELGVNHVLEGSVRKSGSQVRVTAQLIKADDGFHLWSASYDRELTNIFAIQDEIASSIAEALKVSLKLKKGAAGNQTGTLSIEAYEHYLKGMSLWYERTVESLRQSIDEFNQAISLDPGFAKAYAGLALTWTVIEGYVTIDPGKSLANASAAANRALALDPENVEAMAALGNVATAQFDYAKATAYFDEAIRLNPSFATAHQWYALLFLSKGEPEEALIRMQQAWSLDPLSRIIGNNLAETLQLLGRWQEAISVIQEVINLAPDFPEGLRVMMHLALNTGDCESVARYGNRLAALLKKQVNATPVYLDICQSADPGLRRAAIETILSWPGHSFSLREVPILSYPEDLIVMLVNLGEFDSALFQADRDGDYYSHIVLTRVGDMRTENGTKFYCDPRFQAILEKYGIPSGTGSNTCD